MRGINTVAVSGHVVDEDPNMDRTNSGRMACGFRIVCNRKDWRTLVKINAYAALADVCASRLYKGQYVVVEGELMSRESASTGKTLLEVRAREIVFGEDQ